MFEPVVDFYLLNVLDDDFDPYIDFAQIHQINVMATHSDRSDSGPGGSSFSPEQRGTQTR